MSSAKSEWENIVKLKGDGLEQFPKLQLSSLKNRYQYLYNTLKKRVFGPYDNKLSATCKDDYDQCNADAEKQRIQSTLHHLGSATGKGGTEIMGTVNG